MMKPISIFCILILALGYQSLLAQSLSIPLDSDPNRSATYHESIRFYQNLRKKYPSYVTIETFGNTDIGIPLHIVTISKRGKDKGKLVTLINNAIHPGEPDGVDATMIFARELLADKTKISLLDHQTIVIIPFFNIDGAFNRNSFSRANQNGPKEYGFRGNAKNLDLNRDFIKMDSENTKSLVQIIRRLDPQVFVDNHVSDGADYPYTMTLLCTMYENLGADLGDFLKNHYTQDLFKRMKALDDPMVPYVMSNDNPFTGIYGFYDTPRYSSGYTSLFRSIGLVPETHMLKPFKQRVLSNLNLLNVILQTNHSYRDQIQNTQKIQLENDLTADSLTLWWKMDKSKSDSLLFKGYLPKYKQSDVHLGQRLYYDKSETKTANIPFFDFYESSLKCKVPRFYVIPQAYSEVIQRLKMNGVTLNRLTKDTLINVQMSKINTYQTVKEPYEGHYLHYDINTTDFITAQKFYKGDYIVPTRQKAIKYIVQGLEPRSGDSFFAWNFFDGILMRKEYYSDYVFEDTASEILKNNPTIKTNLDNKIKADSVFAKDFGAQLRFVYENSKYSETTYKLYPVGRIM